jgi:hypothetical protein
VPRFVVLEHDWPTRHWDLLLEAGPVLKAWRLLSEPGNGRAVPAEPNFDHRFLYLEYEGPLSGNRGSVRRWDAGTFQGTPGGPMFLNGGRLNGRALISPTETGWTFEMSDH